MKNTFSDQLNFQRLIIFFNIMGATVSNEFGKNLCKIEKLM